VLAELTTSTTWAVWRTQVALGLPHTAAAVSLCAVLDKRIKSASVAATELALDLGVSYVYLALCELAFDIYEYMLETVPWLGEAAACAVDALSAMMETTQLVRKFERKPMSESMSPLLVAMIISILCFAMCCKPSTNIDLLFRISVTLLSMSYVKAVVTDPGGIPETWSDSPGVLSSIQDLIVERKKSTGEPRFCTKERKYKPDRAHFCSATEQNVLRMDHYCPWMSTCIGFYNHKFFLLFLLYTTIAANTAMFSIIHSLASDVLPPGATVFMLQTLGLALLVSAVLTPFCTFHFWLLSRNMTTIEFCEHRGRGASGFESPYDLGWVHNVESVLGKDMYLWFFPTGGPPGDGLSWQRRRDSESQSV